MSNTNKKAAPVQPKAASKTNCSNCTTCTCGKQPQQATLFEIPALEAQAGTVADYLLTHKERARQDLLASILQTDRRGIRQQCQDANGAILFFSQADGGGLLHIQHANEFEFRQYRAEFESRIRSMQDRLNASIGLWLAMGRTL